MQFSCVLFFLVEFSYGVAKVSGDFGLALVGYFWLRGSFGSVALTRSALDSAYVTMKGPSLAHAKVDSLAHA